MCCEQLQFVWLLVLEAGMVVTLAEGLVETRQYNMRNKLDEVREPVKWNYAHFFTVSLLMILGQCRREYA